MDDSVIQILIGLVVAVLYVLAEFFPAALKWLAERAQKRREQVLAERARQEDLEVARDQLPGGQRGVFADDARVVPPPLVEPESPQRARQRELEAALGRLESDIRNEARTLQTSLVNQAMGRALEDRLGGYVQTLLQDLKQAPLEAAPAVALDGLAARLDWARHGLRVALRVVEQRRSGALNEPLGDADSLARAFLEPLHDWNDREGLVQLPAHEPVSLISGSRTEAGAPSAAGVLDTTDLASLGFAMISLPPSFPGELGGWVAVPHAAGRSMLYSVPDLRWEVMSRFGLPERQAIGFGFPGYLTQEQVVGPFGPWLPCLFGDVLGTALLGPVYCQALSAELADREEPLQVVVAPTDPSGGFYAATPPPHLRMLASCTALQEVGFGVAAGEIWQAWNEAHGRPARLVIPMRLEGWTDVALTQFAGVTQNLARLLINEPFTALGEVHLRGIPRLLFSADDQQVAEQAARGLVAGETLSVTDPRLGLAAVIMAAHQNPIRTSSYVTALRQMITPRSRRSSREQVAARARRPERAAHGGAAATAALLADAVMLGAVLERRGVGVSGPRRPRPGRR